MLSALKQASIGAILPILFLLGTTEIKAQDPCTFQIDVGEDLNLFAGESYPLFVATSIPPAAVAGISWTPDTGLSCSDCYDPVATPTEEGCYVVSVTDTAGCTVSDTLCFLRPTAAHEAARPGQTVAVFPNPVKDILAVKTAGHPITAIELLDARGLPVKRISGFREEQTMLDVAELPAGVYYLRIGLGRGFVVEKFLKL